mmetsp:Transcript_672/g.1156  ORF Transcript_672/g.1156 Transcript_672/m.1156 type:complete len:287 (+) Transcript_672:89-949(+)
MNTSKTAVMNPKLAALLSTLALSSMATHLFLLIAIHFLPSSNAQHPEDKDSIAVGSSTTTLFFDFTWPSFLNLCDRLAPYCGVLCFLAPLPTIRQVSAAKTVGNLPLLPYSSMVSNGFVWVMSGLLKDLPSVWMSNLMGVALGSYYFFVFTRHCGPLAVNLPGTVSQHLKGASGIILFNLMLPGVLTKDFSSDIIGKEGVVFCIVLFASPLAALKHVILTKSAVSIPLPFTLACTLNCALWSTVGLWKMRDFNIYFPNLLGLSCALAQLGLKGIYGNQVVKAGLPK